MGTRSGSSLVTGAGRGLGAAIAEALAGRGDHVVLADFDPEVHDTAARLRAAGLSAEAVSLDVADEEAVVSTVAALERVCPISVLVNNAGVGAAGPTTEFSAADFDRVYRVNVRGTFLMMREVVRGMAGRRSGAIVNICSTSSFTASTSPSAAYDASKAAVAMMTKSAAREFASRGVRINGVAPGTMDTALTRDLGADEASFAALAAARIPAGRLGTVAEVAAAVAWLSSDAASYAIGTVLVVDGGWLS